MAFLQALESFLTLIGAVILDERPNCTSSSSLGFLLFTQVAAALS
jgi:hypothetical protein